MTLVSGRTSTLNPDAPLFVPAAVRRVEDFSPEWWDLATTSTWFHDYWLSQQQSESEFFSNTDQQFDSTSLDLADLSDLLPDSIDTDDDMESQYEQFLIFSETERVNAYAPPALKQLPANGSRFELVKAVNGRGQKSPVETARYWEKPAKPVSPKLMCTQRIQQPR